MAGQRSSSIYRDRCAGYTETAVAAIDRTAAGLEIGLLRLAKMAGHEVGEEERC